MDRRLGAGAGAGSTDHGSDAGHQRLT